MTKKRKIYKILICAACALALVGAFSVSAAVIDVDFGDGTDLYASDLFKCMQGEVKMYSYPPLANETVYTFNPSIDIITAPSSWENTFSYQVSVDQFRLAHNLGLYLDPGADEHRIFARYCFFDLVPEGYVLSSFNKDDTVHLELNVRQFIGFISNSVNVTIYFNAPGFNSLSTVPVIYKQAFDGTSPNNLLVIDWTVPVDGVHVVSYRITFDRQSGGVGEFDYGSFGNTSGTQDFMLTLDSGSLISDRYVADSSTANSSIDEYGGGMRSISGKFDEFSEDKFGGHSIDLISGILDPYQFSGDTPFVNSVKIWGSVLTEFFHYTYLEYVFYAFLAIGAGWIFFGVVPGAIRTVRAKFSKK